MDGGAVAASRARVTTVWRREDVIYAADPGAPEQALEKGRNPVVVLGPKGPLRAWETEGSIVMRSSAGAAIQVGRGRFAAFGAAPGGKGDVVLVWEDPEQGVMLRRASTGE